LSTQHLFQIKADRRSAPRGSSGGLFIPRKPGAVLLWKQKNSRTNFMNFTKYVPSAQKSVDSTQLGV